MQKICILCVLILTMLVSTVFAQNIDENRWFWISSDNEYTTYIDKETIKYNPITDSTDLWICLVKPVKNKLRLEHLEIFYKNNQYSAYEYAIYENNHSIPIDSGNFYEIKRLIMPSTLGETIRDRSSELVGRDKKLAEYKEQQQAIKEQKENEKQEGIDKEEAQEKQQ